MAPKSVFLTKTFLINALGALAIILQDPAVLGILPPGWTPKLVGILAVINVINRLYTDQPASITGAGQTFTAPK